MTSKIKRDKLGRFARVHSPGSPKSRKEIQMALLEDVAREQARIELTGKLTPGMKGKVRESLKLNLGEEAAKAQAQREVMANLTAKQVERLKVVLDIQNNGSDTNETQVQKQGKGKLRQKQDPQEQKQAKPSSQASRSDEINKVPGGKGKIPDHLLPAKSPFAKSTPATPEPPPPPKDTKPPKKPVEMGRREGGSKKPRKPTLRTPLPDNALSMTSGGKITLLSEKKRKHHKTFDTQQNKTHNYQVTVDGKQVSLNSHSTQMKYKGEVVNGVPSTFENLRSASNTQLVQAMAEYSQYINDPKAKAPAPKWNPKQHGKLDKEFVGKDGYGSMQIHHVNQWSKTRFNEVTDKILSGEISLEEGKKIARDLLKPDANQKQGYSIDVLAKGNRTLVVLPGGSHDFTNGKMYLANHPKLVHPDTGKMTKFGIPKTGEGGRKYFTSWFRGFWKEYYKHELTNLEREANNRISSGKMKPQDFKKAWDKELQKQRDWHETVKNMP